MKLFKILSNLTVDIVFALVMLGLLIWHLIEPEKNFTLSLWVVFGYAVNVIRNKAMMNKKPE